MHSGKVGGHAAEATSINHTGKRGLFTDGLRHTFQWGTACKK